MAPGDVVYRVCASRFGKRTPIVSSATVKQVRKDGILLASREAGWQYNLLVMAKHCALTVGDAIEDYRARCTVAVSGAREALAEAEEDLRVAMGLVQ